MEHCGSWDCYLVIIHLFPKLLEKMILINVMFGHMTFFGNWNIIRHVSSIGHAPESLLVPKKRNTEVPQSTHGLKSETEISQLTWRPVSMTLNTHCYIPLSLGMVVVEQYLTNTSDRCMFHTLLGTEWTLRHDRYDSGLLHVAYIL